MNPSEQGEALLCGTLPGPRGEGGEWSQGINVTLVQILWMIPRSEWQLFKSYETRLGSWEVVLRTGWRRVSGTILFYRFKHPGIELSGSQIETFKQIPWHRFVQTFNHTNTLQGGGGGAGAAPPPREEELSAILWETACVQCQLLSFLTCPLPACQLFNIPACQLVQCEKSKFPQTNPDSMSNIQHNILHLNGKTEHSITRDIWAARYY